MSQDNKFAKEIIYQAEKLNARNRKPSSKLPEPLKKARKMENGDYWYSRQDIFYDQGLFLADYEDNYVYEGDPLRYYPTYQSLTDEELRGYFTWRTKFRKEIYAPAPLSFLFIYAYEMINNIGVLSPMDGYDHLVTLISEYGDAHPRLLDYMGSWMQDYVVYYDLDPDLLPEMTNAIDNENLHILDNIQNESCERVITAIKNISPHWLARSKFYSLYTADMDQIIFRVLRAMSEHYKKKCKNTFVEQYFGEISEEPHFLFNQAIFCNPLKRMFYVYRLNKDYVYKCEDGYWSIYTRGLTTYSKRKFNKLLKTIDCQIRQEFSYTPAIKSEISTKWICNLIRQEAKALLEEKSEKKKVKVRIDYGSLDKIRTDSAITREKLIVDEDLEIEPEEEKHNTQHDQKNLLNEENHGLNQSEYRLLHCLLYGGTLNWIREEGLIISVLVDSINEKLYDRFGDAVIDDTPSLIEDYIEDLKEII